MRLLALDPGRMSGWFCLDFSTWAWVGGEMPHDALLDWLDPHLTSSTSPLVLWRLDRVLMEGFRIGPRTYQTTSSDETAWSIKQIGAVEMWCRRLGLPMDRQLPAAMKYDESGDKIRRMGWWSAMPGVKGEKGHRRAAAKHALKWGVDHRLIDAGVFL